MTEVDDKKETLESKEEVICPICSNFEPQAWRKNMCRNCFHPLDEHGSNEENNDISSAKDKKLENDKVNDMQKKKSETDTSKKKGEPPKTFPKSKNPNLSVDISKKDTSGTNSCNSPISPLKKTGSTFIKSPESKDFKSKSPLSPTKTPDDSKSKGKESIFSQKNVSHSKFETKKAESSKDNEKHVASAPSALTKWKENENKSLSKDKGPSGEENKQIGKQAQSKADDNKNKLDEKGSKFQSKTPGLKDKKEQDTKTPGSSSLTNRDNTPKSKTDDASKVRQFAKTFGSDLEESRCNSLERQKKEKLATTAPANDQCKSAIKNQSTPEATQKDTNSTSGKEKESSALYEKISRFTHTGLKKTDKNDKSYGSLDRKRQKSEEKTPETSAEAGRRIDAELETVKKQLSCMEIKCKALESENDKLRSGLKEKETAEHSLKTQKAEVENAIKSLRDTLQSMADRCGKLENDNETLLDKLKLQQIQQQEAMTTANKEEIESMEAQLSESENDIENIKSENEDLKQEILDLKVEMEEMYDSFRDQEAEEFRDLQRELEMTAKNCRVLQFKLRKAERRSEQVEIDRQSCEEKLHLLQNQFEDADARAHIRSIEDELRMAKEVSVRLHDELDILDDKRQKCEEENSHLTRLLEQSDKKQFRLEMEVDKLRDQVISVRSLFICNPPPPTPNFKMNQNSITYKHKPMLFKIHFIFFLNKGRF